MTHLLLHKTPNSVSSEPGAAHWLPHLDAPIVDLKMRDGYQTWLLGAFIDNVHPIAAELSLPVGFDGQFFTEFGKRIILISGDRGVRVFSLAEETRHLDAYSFWRNEKPYVFLNTAKTPEHSRFDAAHELGHLVMHRHSGSAHKSAEDEAHTFASAFLMPRADLLAHIPRVRSLDDLIKAKKRWGVSVAALNYSLHKIGVISDWHYRSYYIELNKLGRHIEPDGIEPETSQVWTKILTALWREGTTLGHIARELKIPEKELSNLLFGIAAPPNSPPKATRELRLVK